MPRANETSGHKLPLLTRFRYAVQRAKGRYLRAFRRIKRRVDARLGSADLGGNRDFDADRFRELVLYIAHKTKGDPAFGRTKLAKVLFYADFEAYASDGRSLTGATYRALEHGPFPTELAAAEKELQRERRAVVERWEPPAEKGEYDPNHILPKDAPKLELFEAWEWTFVDHWIKEISRASAKRISELSHEHPGWQLHERDHSVIPYETQFVGRTRPSERSLERGRQLAHEFKWI